MSSVVQEAPVNLDLPFADLRADDSGELPERAVDRGGAGEAAAL